MEIENIIFPIVLITYISAVIIYANYKHKKSPDK
jgi:hypothetical protein